MACRLIRSFCKIYFFSKDRISDSNKYGTVLGHVKKSFGKINKRRHKNLAWSHQRTAVFYIRKNIVEAVYKEDSAVEENSEGMEETISHFDESSSRLFTLNKKIITSYTYCFVVFYDKWKYFFKYYYIYLRIN